MISTGFASFLEANRDGLNHRFEAATRSSKRINGAGFLDALGEVAAPVFDAAEAAGGDPQAVGTGLYDTLLDLFHHGALGPTVRRAWTTLLVAGARFVADDPRRSAAAISNATYRLDQAPRVSVDDWLQAMAAVQPDVVDLDQWLVAGQVAAWRAGMAVWRDEALTLAESLPDAVLLPVLGARVDQLAAMKANRWFDPANPTAPVSPRRVGGFRGFGGPFARPPAVFWRDDMLLATDGVYLWRIVIDVFGHTVVRLERADPDMAVPPAPPETPESLRETPKRLRDLDAGSAWIETEVGLILTSARSHFVTIVGTP